MFWTLNQPVTCGTCGKFPPLPYFQGGFKTRTPLDGHQQVKHSVALSSQVFSQQPKLENLGGWFERDFKRKSCWATSRFQPPNLLAPPCPPLAKSPLRVANPNSTRSSSRGSVERLEYGYQLVSVVYSRHGEPSQPKKVRKGTTGGPSPPVAPRRRSPRASLPQPKGAQLWAVRLAPQTFWLALGL